MISKKFVQIALSLCMFVGSSAFAQDQMPPKTPEERAQHQTMWMQKNLKLTEAQHKKVYDIILYYARQNENTKAQRPGAQKKAEKQAIMKDKDTDLRAVLTGQQYDMYQQHVGEMKAKAQQRKAAMQNGDY